MGAVAEPHTWCWATLRCLVIQWGEWRVYHVPRRYRAEVARQAGAHGLKCLTEGDTLRLVL